MTRRGPKKADNTFYNRRRVRDSFAALPTYEKYTDTGERPERSPMRIAKQLTTAYETRPQGEKADIVLALIEIHKTCWIEWEPSTGKRLKWDVKRIGIWGQIWALAVLWSLVCGEDGREHEAVKETVNRIINFGKNHNHLPQEDEFKHEISAFKGSQLVFMIEDPKKVPKLLITSYRELLTTYLGRGNSKIPSIEASKAVLKCFADYVLQHLDASKTFKPRKPYTLAKLLDHLSGEPYRSPRDCFDGLVNTLGIREEVDAREADIDNIPKQIGDSWLEPSVWNYITSLESDKRTPSPDDVKKVAITIHDSLNFVGAPQGDESQIVILSGPAHAGKKAIVGDVLKGMVKQTSLDALALVARGRGKTKDVLLPVLCIQTRERDYISLCIEVLVFLERITEPRSTTPQDDELNSRWAALDLVGGAPSLRSLLDRIQELHSKTAAFFVFLDANVSAQSDMGNLLRRRGVRRLMETLFNSNVESRFLVTMDRREDVFSSFEPKHFTLKRPTCARISWYLNDDQLPSFERAASQHFDGMQKREVDGDVLMAMAVLFSEKDIDDADFFQLLETVSDHKNDGPRKPDDNPVETVCRRLVQCWEKQDLIPYIALVAASDDGMMAPTIEKCVTRWTKEVPNLKIESLDKGIERLSSIAALGRGLFLRFQVPPDLLEEEVRFDEPKFTTATQEYFRTWEFDPGFAQVLRRIFSREPDYQVILRQAHRLIAEQARSRSRFRQLNGITQQRTFGPQVPERGIQAFIALLLSLEAGLDYQDVEASPRSFANDDVFLLSGTASRVFTVSDDFDQSLAIQYAYIALLKNEADHDHRLSMALDTDLLRLQLYTLLCANPGTIGLWDGKHLRHDRDNLPAELKKATLAHLVLFPVLTRADILTGLAMAAFYCRHLPILVWAEERIFAYAALDRKVVENLSRVIAARVDLECQIGRPLKMLEQDRNADENANNGSGKKSGEPGLSYIRSVLEEDVGKLDIFAPNLSELDSDEVAPWKSRLGVRLTYLDYLVKTPEDISQPRPFPFRPEDFLATKNGMVYGEKGRSGRLRMKTSLRQFPLISDRRGANWGTPLTQVAPASVFEGIVDKNTLRLAHHSGSERALTILDYARALIVQGEVREALAAVQLARRVCFFGGSSESVRLEVLFLQTAITISALEHIPVDEASIERDVLAETISLNFELIDQIMKDYRLQFETAMRETLAWRAQLMANRLGLELEIKDVPAKLKVAIDIARKFGAEGLCSDLEWMDKALKADAGRSSGA